MERRLDTNVDGTSSDATKRTPTRLAPIVAAARRRASVNAATLAAVWFGLGCGGAPTRSVGSPLPLSELDVTVVPHFEGHHFVLETTISNNGQRELVVYPQYLLFERLSVGTLESGEPLIVELVNDGSEALYATSCVDVIGVRAAPGDVLRFVSRYDVALDGLESAEIEVETTACITYSDALCEDESEKVCSHSTSVIRPSPPSGY